MMLAFPTVDLLLFADDGLESPSGVSASESGSVGSWDVDLVFTPPSTSPTGYTVQVSVDGGAFSTVTPDATAGSNPITYTFNSLGDATYQYRIRADYDGESSAYTTSNIVNAFVNMSFDFTNRHHAIAA